MFKRTLFLSLAMLAGLAFGQILPAHAQVINTGYMVSRSPGGQEGFTHQAAPGGHRDFAAPSYPQHQPTAVEPARRGPAGDGPGSGFQRRGPGWQQRGPGWDHRPIDPGRRDWDRDGRFNGRYWGGWDLHIYRGAWFVFGPVNAYDPYGVVWVYVWTSNGYVPVQSYFDPNTGRYWYYGYGNVIVWLP